MQFGFRENVLARPKRDFQTAFVVLHSRLKLLSRIDNISALTMAPLQSDPGKEEQLKAALWYSVGQTIDGVSLAQDINATPHFIGALSEMLWTQIGMLSEIICRPCLLTWGRNSKP